VRKTIYRFCGLAFSALTFTAVGGYPAVSQPIDLSGQTVTLIHNVSPGGATGIVATLAAQAWSKTMAGNPTMIVQSVEGGAMSRGILQVMNSRPDGKTVGWVAWSGATRVLDPAELQIPFRDFGLIGGVGAGHFFVHASTSVGGGITTRDEFVEKAESFTFGGFAAKSASSMRTAAALDMLGVPYKFVSGFGGNGPLLAAMQRGEIDGYPASSDAYIRNLRDEWIAEGQSLGLFYFSPPNSAGTGLSVDPSMPELEPFDSYYRRVKGEEPAGPLWEMIKFHGRISDRVNWLIVAPPKTPEAHLAMLRESFARAMEDPEFIEGAEKVFGVKPVLVTFPDIADVVEEVSRTDQGILDTMKDYLGKMEH